MAELQDENIPDGILLILGNYIKTDYPGNSIVVTQSKTGNSDY